MGESVWGGHGVKVHLGGVSMGGSVWGGHGVKVHLGGGQYGGAMGSKCI